VYVQVLLISLLVLFVTAVLIHEVCRALQRVLRFHGPDAGADAPACANGMMRGGNKRALELLETLWLRQNGMKVFAVLTLNISYIYVTGVLLEAWDCFTTSDGVTKMRNDPKTICDSASHLRLRRLATALIVIIGPGVPICHVLWIRRLKRVAKNEHLLVRRSWRGVADPLTRARWGTLYEAYKFINAESSPGALTTEQPATRRQRLVARIQAAQFRACVAMSTYFESSIYVQKMLLVLATHLVGGVNGKAGVQVAVYAVFATILLFVWPYRQLDVRISLLGWAPVLPRRMHPAAPGAGVDSEYKTGWRKAQFGYVWSSHLTITDALNWTALSANVVPLITLVCGLLFGSDNSNGVLGIFLIVRDALRRWRA
jgi:hypothetical protein